MLLPLLDFLVLDLANQWRLQLICIDQLLFDFSIGKQSAVIDVLYLGWSQVKNVRHMIGLDEVGIIG
jgi:hypothetical protein